MLEITIKLNEQELPVSERDLEKAFRDGIKEGTKQFAAELKEYVCRSYENEKGIARATAAHIVDIIDDLMPGCTCRSVMDG